VVACEWRGFLSIEVQPCGSHTSNVRCPGGVVHASLECSPKTLYGPKVANGLKETQL